MKKILILLIFLYACNGKPGVDGHEFIGEWVLSEQSPMYGAAKNLELKIYKDGIFYHVSLMQDGKDFLDQFAIKKRDKETEAILGNAHNYQLSQDKIFLVATSPLSVDALPMLTYNDDNKTIQTQFGWFRRK